MFHFTSYSTPPLFIEGGAIRYYPDWVAPFGDLRIEAYLRLPEAYRSLPRPSSPEVCQVSHHKPFVA